MERKVESEIIIGIESTIEKQVVKHLVPSNCQEIKVTYSDGELICSSCGTPVVFGTNNQKEQNSSGD